jgi:hypothetical protein
VRVFSFHIYAARTGFMAAAKIYDRTALHIAACGCEQSMAYITSGLRF